ncbi:MAG: hypothetical protein P8M03_06395 [Flavobacteriaceae bacterium]|nr:hypothetical protein [Flavobacteriaceae bacterium]
MLIRPFFLFFILINTFCFGQKFGWEGRTNGKEFLKIGFKNFELRYRTNNSENRLSFSQKIWKDKKVTLKIPLHYKFEKEITTLEPKLYFNFEKFKLWMQKEFWVNLNSLAAIGVESPFENYTFYVGWDTSETFRFGLSYKIKKQSK